MYETEANSRIESFEQLPSTEVHRFGEISSTVRERTVLPWSEHCTECVWPTCYSSCDLYSPREDGKCRRFIDGMVRVPCSPALNAYLLKVTFKQWAKLWTPGNTQMRTIEHAAAIERRDYRIGTMITHLPSPLKTVASTRRYSFKKRLAYRSPILPPQITSFLLECYNPAPLAVGLSLSIFPKSTGSAVPFLRLLQIAPGFNRVRISYCDIAAVVALNEPFTIELIPNGEATAITLFFGLMDFVREDLGQGAPTSDNRERSVQQIKCVVWDLDNTLWHGVVIEDGAEHVRLNEGMKETIQELDKRGILQSVASKNNPDDAMIPLKRFGLNEYLLAPQISWHAKSLGIQKVARELNIGLDSILFVDDSEFERVQVSAALPQVRTLDAADYRNILTLPGCQPTLTEEGKGRRRLYREEEKRRDLASGFADDYIAFLRHCEIRMGVRRMSDGNLDRVHELTQRTNQMNFSGNKYDRAILQSLHAAPHLDTYVIDVEDRFGSYGVVGFAIVDSRVPVMTDLMFSCRIQSKRIEHAFLTFLLRTYIPLTGRDFQALYRKTPRNAPSGKVFDDIGMIEQESKDGVARLAFPRDQAIPDDQVVTITAYGSYAKV